MDLSSMRPSSWNGVGAMAKVPAALWVSLVICASISLLRHSGMVRKDQTSDAQLRIGESRDSGFDASHRPGMTFRDGPKDQTPDAQLRIGESRDSGFDASH